MFEEKNEFNELKWTDEKKSKSIDENDTIDEKKCENSGCSDSSISTTEPTTTAPTDKVRNIQRQFIFVHDFIC